MAEYGLNGLIIWGFIRDSHGGVAASRELCRYAAERGVRVLPGVGTSGYAGYVFEGNHRYNAHTCESGIMSNTPNVMRKT